MRGVITRQCNATPSQVPVIDESHRRAGGTPRWCGIVSSKLVTLNYLPTSLHYPCGPIERNKRDPRTEGSSFQGRNGGSHPLTPEAGHSPPPGDSSPTPSCFLPLAGEFQVMGQSRGQNWALAPIGSPCLRPPQSSPDLTGHGPTSSVFLRTAGSHLNRHLHIWGQHGQFKVTFTFSSGVCKARPHQH